MNVFDGDLEQLEWNVGKTRIKIYSSELECIKENPMTKYPPRGEIFEKILAKAKEASKDLEEGSIFVVMQDTMTKETIPFVEYKKGDLVAFCRPPWRRKKTRNTNPYRYL
jgi:hypothetical protein